MEKEVKGGEGCPLLLDLIPNGRERGWGGKVGSGERNRFGVSEDEKLELKLGLPGGEDWPAEEKKEEQSIHSALSLGFLSKVPKSSTIDASSEAKRAFFGAVEPKAEAFQQQQLQKQCFERKACGPPPSHASATRNAAVVAHSISQRRAVTSPVVGWPPIRSFRKNLASNNKPSLESKNGSSDAAKKLENSQKGLFVKINMDGVPIGRKIDLKAYDSYDKLSLAVDELFRGLLAAQKDPLTAEAQKSTEKMHVIWGLLEGNGEYTLVYEDDEGDRMLVGDVPWDMFVSTAKRLRVLKSSELAASPLGAASRKRTANQC